MMMNLFSIFDPSSSSNLSLNWLAMMSFSLVIPVPFFFIYPMSKMLLMKMVRILTKEFNLLAKPNNMGSILFFISMFIFIFSTNYMGLYPFIFTTSSHILMTFSLSMTIWTAIMITLILMNFNTFMAHLVPQGTPMLLSFFMVMIETVSILIRPITLAVRLAANMIAGHLLISLVSNIASFQLKNSLTSIILQTMLILLETAVALIQAFVFTILSLLYSIE
uniref:ATP synthase subunit a n=1 Tax=Songthela hangzhouensis TaxID=1649374 RepID=Q6JT41_9ARAC|nr:ATP synthase F0 subunit 6 [Songthela hangzhouensis]AAP51137.1 ATP synthase F0 subunit 6 [Songthela hangzhouensis]